MSRLEHNAAAETFQVTNFHFDFSNSSLKRKSVVSVARNSENSQDSKKRLKKN